MIYIGEIAALFTAFCWSLSAIGFSIAGRHFSSQVTNRVRVTMAFLALLLINAILYGQPIPLNAGSVRWGWLMFSGIVGLALGDAFLFRSYQLVGPRIGLLLLSLAPVFGAAIAWLFFGEQLSLLQFAGMVITLAGIGWVVLTRPALQAGEQQTRLSLQGVLFGVIAALGQAGGLVLSKQGMSNNFPPFAGTLIRMIAAIIFLWVMAIFQKQVGNTVDDIRAHPGSQLRRGQYARRVGASAAVYMAAVLEYLTAELLELTVKAATSATKKGKKVSRLNPRILTLAVRHDEDLGALLQNVTLSRGGVLPAVNKALNKQKEAKKSTATPSA